MGFRTCRRVGLGAVWALVAVCLSALSPATAATAGASVTSAQALPTVQVDGAVWTQIIVGNTVYAAGSFANARPAGSALGTNETARSNLLAYNLTTGALDTSFAPATVNGEVLSLAISPDHSRLYIGGAFTRVGSSTRNRVAALNPTTGTLLSGFSPAMNGSVYALAATGSNLYIGGNFTAVGSTARTRVAELTSAGAVVNGFRTTIASGKVSALTLSPKATRLAIGGNFTSVAGSSSPGYGLALLDAGTGASLPLAANAQVRDAGDNSSILSLTSDSSGFYGSGYRYQDGGVNNLEGVFKAGWDGTLTWVADCHGDTYSVAVASGVVYAASHQHYCGNLGAGGFYQTPSPWAEYFATAFTTSATGENLPDQYGYPSHTGQPSPSLLDFYPEFTVGTVKGQATWSVATNGTYVVYGGEFPTVNGTGQQGLVRFALRSVAPSEQGPELEGHLVAALGGTSAFGLNTSTTLTARGIAADTVRLTWPGYTDPDNSTLTYEIYRSDSTTPIHSETVTRPWWTSGTLAWTDTGVTSSTATYYLRVVDPDGNAVTSSPVTVSVPSSGALSGYDSAVLADGATTYWRLDSVGAATDVSGTNDVSASTTSTVTGPDSQGAAEAFADSTAAIVAGQRAALTPNQLSEEIWVRTTATSGELAGYVNAASGGNPAADRMLTLDSSGHVVFEVYRGDAQTIRSTTAINDDTWHQVVATLGPAGMSLYVDGALQATRRSVPTAITYAGRWSVGGDGYAGALARASLYPSQLNAAQVASHWIAAGHSGGTSVTGPVAAFTSSTRYYTASLNAAGSTAGNGIASYAWDFGDGTTATGLTASHTYAAAGTYPVTLTVTSASGVTDSVTQQVSVTTSPVVILDGFNRSVAKGWGALSRTRRWTTGAVRGESFSVSGSAGRIKLSARNATGTVSTTGISGNTDLYAQITNRSAPTGGGTVVALTGRMASTSNAYRARLVFTRGGRVQLQLSRVVGGTERILASRTVLTGVKVGQAVSLRLRLTGTSPTTQLSARAWTGSVEPSAWQVSAKDSTAVLARATGVGVWAALSPTATAVPVSVSVDRFTLTAQ